MDTAAHTWGGSSPPPPAPPHPLHVKLNLTATQAMTIPESMTHSPRTVTHLLEREVPLDTTQQNS